MSILDCTITVQPQKVDRPDRTILIEATCPICLRQIMGDTILTIQEQHSSPLVLVNTILHKVTAVQIKMQKEWRAHLAEHIAEDRFAPPNCNLLRTEVTGGRDL